MRNGGIGLIAAIALGMAACASEPVRPAPGRAGAAGTVRLTPPAGAPHHGGSGTYTDRRLHDVRWVDYSTPGFTVVYLDAGDRPGGSVKIAVEATRTGVRLAPRLAAVGVGGEILLENRSGRPAVLSAPGVGRIEHLDDGAETAIEVEHAGPLEVFLLGEDDSAVVWAAPGPWAHPGADGRYALRDLPPGRATLRVWHPRLPPDAAEVELVADETTSVDFELGTGRGEDPHAVH